MSTSRVLCLLLMFAASQAQPQEVMTLEQLLNAGNSEATALAAALYINGWKDGTGLQMASQAQDLQATRSPTAQQTAARLQAVSNCLLLLEVADVATVLHAAIRDNSIEPDTAARSALRVAMERLCPGMPGQNG